MIARYHRHGGFTLVTTIFFIVVLAALGLFMATISSTQRATSTFAIVGPRAWFAARSGMEWGAATALAGGTCFPSPTTFALNGGTTTGYSVALTCSETTVTEGPATYNVYNLQVVAFRGVPNGEDYFSRTLNASVTDAP